MIKSYSNNMNKNTNGVLKLKSKKFLKNNRIFKSNKKIFIK